MGEVYTKEWTGSQAVIEYVFHGMYFGDGEYPKYKQNRAENSLKNGSYGYYYWYGHWKRECNSYFGQIIFDASCTHPAVVRTLKRFRLHERIQDLRDHLYPNRPRCAAICDVSRDSRREQKPRKHDHTGVKEPNEHDLYVNAWGDLVCLIVGFAREPVEVQRQFDADLPLLEPWWTPPSREEMLKMIIDWQCDFGRPLTPVDAVQWFDTVVAAGWVFDNDRDTWEYVKEMHERNRHVLDCIVTDRLVGYCLGRVVHGSSVALKAAS